MEIIRYMAKKQNKNNLLDIKITPNENKKIDRIKKRVDQETGEVCEWHIIYKKGMKFNNKGKEVIWSLTMDNFQIEFVKQEILSNDLDSFYKAVAELLYEQAFENKEKEKNVKQ